MEQIMTGIVRNEAGVLALIADKFREMNININSINASETEDKHLSCITLVTEATDVDIEKIHDILSSVVEIQKLEILEPGDHYERELALVKVSLESDEMSHIMQVAEVFRARVVGIGKGSITLELVGETEQVKGFIDMLRPFGILGVARTGRTALKKD